MLCYAMLCYAICVELNGLSTPTFFFLLLLLLLPPRVICVAFVCRRCARAANDQSVFAGFRRRAAGGQGQLRRGAQVPTPFGRVSVRCEETGVCAGDGRQAKVRVCAKRGVFVCMMMSRAEQSSAA